MARFFRLTPFFTLHCCYFGNVATSLHPGTRCVGQYFYSDLFDLCYEAVGELDSSYDIVEDWQEPFRKGVVYYLRDGRVRGVLLWNTWGQVAAATQLIAEKTQHTRETLAGLIGERA